MSTRATIHFKRNKDSEPTAIIYRHSDGYPDGLGKDLQDFCAEVRAKVKDTRFTDPAYLAAKWVVWDAANYAKYETRTFDPKTKEWIEGAANYLNFLSVGIVDQDPGDIEYRYTVVCDGKPTITCESVS